MDIPKEAFERDVSEEALERRARSLVILARESVPYMAQLPAIETSTEVALRPKEEIAYRALSLLTVALKGEGLTQPTVEGIVREHGLRPHLTAKELAFVTNPSPSERPNPVHLAL